MTVAERPYVDQVELSQWDFGKLLFPWDIRYETDFVSKKARFGPFVHGARLWVTDGITLVRKEALGGGYVSRMAKLAPFDVEATWLGLFGEEFGHWEPMELPESDSCRLVVGPEDGNVCPVCCGRRIELERFPESLEEEYELPQYDPDDNTIGDRSCVRCHGRDYDGPSVLEICGLWFAYWRLVPIFRLGGGRMEVSLSPVQRDCLRFRGGGFSGVTMALDWKPGAA